MEGKSAVRLGTVVGRNSRGHYACEALDENGQIIRYLVFTEDGQLVGSFGTVEEAETLLTNLEGAGPPAPSQP